MRFPARRSEKARALYTVRALSDDGHQYWSPYDERVSRTARMKVAVRETLLSYGDHTTNVYGQCKFVTASGEKRPLTVRVD